MFINGYYISDYCCLLVTILLVDILLVGIGGY